MNDRRPLVVGACCIDIKGWPRYALVPRTSNIGTLRRRAGGVGYNIAAHLALLGAEPKFVSAVGRDGDGDAMLAACTERGLDPATIVRFDEATPNYLAVLDEHGDLAVGIAAMDLCEQMTPNRLPSLEPLLIDAPLVIVDANLPLPTLAHIAGLCSVLDVPLWAEPATADKAARLLDILPAVDVVKPNLEELEALVGRRLRDNGARVDAAREIIARGTRAVLVTLGAEGVLQVDAERVVHHPSPAVEVRDVTGAGDALLAAAAWSVTRGHPLERAVLCGIAAACHTLQSDESTPADVAEAVAAWK